MIEYSDFEKVDIRLGKIVEVKDFPEARNPSLKLKIDFGEEIGIKKSVVGIKDLYNKKDLENTFVLGVVNLPPKQIGPTVSECLTIGVPDEEGKVVLVRPDKSAKIGGKLF
ncbi:tRNA-binding protein [Patescibacteria group bacterium]|nr:tRNA-binding protein [Patescibacteria group bacterium]